MYHCSSMNAQRTIFMLVLASCLWTTVHCSEDVCVICDHCEKRNTSSYEKKKCPEVEVGTNVCVTELYESGRVLRRCHRPGEEPEVSCRDSVDPTTSEKVHICSCEPGSCDLGRWGITKRPLWHHHDTNTHHGSSTFTILGINTTWQVVLGVFGGLIGLVILWKCCCCVIRSSEREADNNIQSNEDNDDEHPPSDAENMKYPNANGATGTGYPTGPTGFPTGATGFPTGATGFPTGATGFPTGATGFPTGATGFPTGATGFPTGATGYPTGATGFPTGATGFPTGATGFPLSPAGLSPSAPGFPASAPGYPLNPAGIPPSDIGNPPRTSTWFGRAT